MRTRFFLTLLLILTFRTVFSHEDFDLKWDFGNVKVKIQTGFGYEEITKVLLFGQQAEQLAKQLNYSNPVSFDFTHTYIQHESKEPDYFISYGKAKRQRIYNVSQRSPIHYWLEEDSIVITQFARQFDAETTLKLLEYAVLNIEKIKSSQKEIVYKKNYVHEKLDSIDTNLIRQALNEPNSIQVNEALSLKIEKPMENPQHGFSYYLQNNQYTLFFRHLTIDTNQTVVTVSTNLITLSNIYGLNEIGHDAVVFDTDSSFYFIQGYSGKISKRHIIQDMNARTYTYTPFVVTHIGGDRLAISWQSGMSRSDRTLIYLIDKDILIQDLGKLIEKSGM